MPLRELYSDLEGAKVPFALLVDGCFRNDEFEQFRNGLGLSSDAETRTFFYTGPDGSSLLLWMPSTTDFAILPTVCLIFMRRILSSWRRNRVPSHNPGSIPTWIGARLDRSPRGSQTTCEPRSGIRKPHVGRCAFQRYGIQRNRGNITQGVRQLERFRFGEASNRGIEARESYLDAPIASGYYRAGNSIWAYRGSTMERVDRLRRGFFSNQLSKFGSRISLTLFCLALAILV